MRLLLFLALAGLLGAFAHAGDVRGNGGGILVCDDGSVELLDLWEGEALLGMVYPGASADALPQALASIALLPKIGHAIMGSEVEATVRRISQHAETERDWFLPSGVAIEPPRDAQNLFMKRGCHLEGVALYDDRSDRLDIDATLFPKLNPQQRAALYVHEAVYKFLRRHNGEQDSTLARHYTACLFSGGDCPELDARDDLPTGGFFDCLYGSERFYLFPVNPADGLAAKQWRIQMVDPRGWPTALRTRLFADIPLTNPRLSSSGYLSVDSAIGLVPGYNSRGSIILHASTDRWRDVGFYQPVVEVSNEGEFHLGYNDHTYCKYQK